MITIPAEATRLANVPERFRKQFQRLAQDNPQRVRQVEKTVGYLLRYPPPQRALRMNRVRGTSGIFECSVNMDIRMVFECVEPDTILLLRNIDHHNHAVQQY